MKYLKKFNEGVSYKIGDIVDEETVYNYCQKIHHTEEDFWDGNISERIEEYNKYKLCEINISDIDINEWYIDETLVNSYMNKYNENNNYPPIVLSSPYF